MESLSFTQKARYMHTQPNEAKQEQRQRNHVNPPSSPATTSFPHHCTVVDCPSLFLFVRHSSIIRHSVLSSPFSAAGGFSLQPENLCSLFAIVLGHIIALYQIEGDALLLSRMLSLPRATLHPFSCSRASALSPFTFHVGCISISER